MLELTLQQIDWMLLEPFTIARETIDRVPSLRVVLRDDDGHEGRGEAVGIDYAGETPVTMAAQVMGAQGLLHDASAATRQALLLRLPVGGARNALDAALWDLEAKQTGVSVAQRIGIELPPRMATAYTIGIMLPEAAAAAARARSDYPLLKVKVDATRHLALVDAVRAGAPDAELIVDANGSWSVEQLERLAPAMQDRGVSLIEQPVAPENDVVLAGRHFALPLAADEAVTDRRSLEGLMDKYQFFNLKLDKSGGLTEALETARLVHEAGGELMVGNMCGSSLAMAPAAMLAPLCRYIDLDGPLLQRDDVAAPIAYSGGWFAPPEPQLWG
jgi:L-Ala-D/L-Glu epimerase